MPRTEAGLTSTLTRLIGLPAILVCAFLAGGALAQPRHTAADYAADARAIEPLIAANYAYLDHLPNGGVPSSLKLNAERDAVHDRDSLLHYAEDMMASLADHHAITGSSFRDSWAVVPSYSDLWIVTDSRGYVVESVREDSPASAAGIRVGDRLTKIGDQPVAVAVAEIWSGLGLAQTPERSAYAARVLAAGRRDRKRQLEFIGIGGLRAVTLDNLYSKPADMPPLAVTRNGHGETVIRFNDSLGEVSTIAAFDAAMAAIPIGRPLILDLSDTPSGGNTTIARAIMGWFVSVPVSYQLHRLPAEERETGIARQWLEQVLPRPGKYYRGPILIKVGRWTGSMGEGLAIGLQTIGKSLCGGRMAGLKGAVYDFALPATGMVLKFPAERLYTVSGTPRETVVPKDCSRY
jgi:carboxyl-terminal processing protease